MGSARSNGNTRLVVDHLAQEKNIPIIDLNDYTIGYFDYTHENQTDDFLPLMERLIAEYDTFIFATPVYWYSMSAQMKTFFDRISDLLKIRKPLGRQLRGKTMASISCSGHDDLVEGFEMPFRESADYLGMKYLGHLHTYVEEEGILVNTIKSKLEYFLA